MALQEYTDLATMRTYLGLNAATQFDSLLQDAITSGSREVDKRCNRYFGREAAVSSRTFDVEASGILFVDDIAEPEPIEVSGLTGFLALPRNGVVDGITGHPITRLKSPYFCEGDSVTVTAVWGWPDVPEVVREACKMIAAETFMQKDTPLGIKSMDEFGSVRLRERQHIRDKLSLYTKYRIVGM